MLSCLAQPIPPLAVCRRGTTILQDSWRQGERRGGKLGDLERFLGGGRGGRRQPPSYAHLVEAAQDVLALLHSFQATANFPHKGEGDLWAARGRSRHGWYRGASKAACRPGVAALALHVGFFGSL